MNPLKKDFDQTDGNDGGQKTSFKTMALKSVTFSMDKILSGGSYFETPPNMHPARFLFISEEPYVSLLDKFKLFEADIRKHWPESRLGPSHRDREIQFYLKELKNACFHVAIKHNPRTAVLLIEDFNISISSTFLDRLNFHTDIDYALLKRLTSSFRKSRKSQDTSTDNLPEISKRHLDRAKKMEQQFLVDNFRSMEHKMFVSFSNIFPNRFRLLKLGVPFYGSPISEEADFSTENFKRILHDYIDGGSFFDGTPFKPYSSVSASKREFLSSSGSNFQIDMPKMGDEDFSSYFINHIICFLGDDDLTFKALEKGFLLPEFLLFALCSSNENGIDKFISTFKNTDFQLKDFHHLLLAIDCTPIEADISPLFHMYSGDIGKAFEELQSHFPGDTAPNGRGTQINRAFVDYEAQALCEISSNGGPSRKKRI